MAHMMHALPMTSSALQLPHAPSARVFSSRLAACAASSAALPGVGGGFSTAATAHTFIVCLQLEARILRCIISCPPRCGGGTQHDSYRTRLQGASSAPGSQLALHHQLASQAWGGASARRLPHAPAARVFSSWLAACAASSATLPSMGGASARQLPHAPQCESPAPGSQLALHLQLLPQEWGGFQHGDCRTRSQRTSSAPGSQLALHLQLAPLAWVQHGSYRTRHSACVFRSWLAACAASSAALPVVGGASARRLPHAPSARVFSSQLTACRSQ